MPLDQPFHLTNNPPGTVIVDADQLEANFNYIMALLRGEGSLPITQPGALQMIAHDTPDTGWLLCDGAAVSRSTYADLFAKIGTKYGAGDGSTTFNLPDMRGRMPVGKGTNTDVDTLGKADAAGLGARKPKHSHSGGTTSSAGSHSHTGTTGGQSQPHVHTSHDGFLTFFSGAGQIWQPNLVGGGSGNFAVAGFTDNNNVDHQHGITTDGSHTHTLATIGDTGGPADGPAYQVVNFQIKV